MKTWAEMTAEFATKNGHPPPQRPSTPDPKVIILRLRLMIEELAELTIAMHANNELEIADGLCDLLYVTVGTAVAYGLGPVLERLFAEVHRSNMTKFSDRPCHFDTGAKYQGSSGKLDTYEPPQLAEIIKDLIRREGHCGERSPAWMGEYVCTRPAEHGDRYHENLKLRVRWQR
jgi:predicted HAD superfamily Cof-like phosphohydrolase